MVQDETIAQRLIILRNMHSLGEKAVSAKLKISVGKYLRMENGKEIPDYFQIRQLMTLYGCTSDYLLFGIMLGLRQDLFRKLTKFEPVECIDDETGEHWKSEGALH